MKNKDTQLLEEAYQKVSQSNPINEGLLGNIGSFISSLINVNKLTKEIANRSNKFKIDMESAKQYGPGRHPEKNKIINEFIRDVIGMFDKSEPSRWIMNLKATFFANVYETLWELSDGESAKGIQKLFDIPDDILNQLTTAYANKDQDRGEFDAAVANLSKSHRDVTSNSGS